MAFITPAKTEKTTARAFSPGRFFVAGIKINNLIQKY